MVPELHTPELIKNETTWVGGAPARKTGPKPQADAPHVDAAPLRLRFEKTGALKYISHLDLNRTMQRLLVRSGMPVWYTEGFNPQVKIVFAAPLSVGCESICELCDIKVTEPVEPEGALARLNKASPPGLRFVDVYAPETKLAEIAFAGYMLTLDGDAVTPDDAERAKQLFSSPVVLMKRTKSGEAETDITRFIREIAFESQKGRLIARMTLSASNTEYLNPEYIATALRTKLDIAGAQTLIRMNFYTADGSVYR